MMYEEDTAKECEDKGDESGGANIFVQSHHVGLLMLVFSEISIFLAFYSA